jgi:RNA polymerase sigma-70 factor (ECF subfamily)
LKKIVINRSLDSVSRNKAIFEDIDTHYELQDKADESALTDPDMEEKMEEIMKAISNLPDGYRIILSLYLLEGYDHDEIGEILDISSSTSGSQLSRAKQKLLNELRNGQVVKQ